MAKDDPAPEAEPAEETVPQTDEPDWARSLRESIEQLPGKLKATISDDDRKSIAEHVHGLFERSGAFHEPEPEPDDEGGEGGPDEPTEPESHDRPPQTKTIAEKLGFPKH